MDGGENYMNRHDFLIEELLLRWDKRFDRLLSILEKGMSPGMQDRGTPGIKSLTETIRDILVEQSKLGSVRQKTVLETSSQKRHLLSDSESPDSENIPKENQRNPS